MNNKRRALRKVIVLLLILFFSVSVGYIYFMSDTSPYINNNSNQEEKVNGNVEYFNGEIIEITEEYICVKPVEDWKWDYVTRVKLPVEGWKVFQTSQFRCGDFVRVPFNSNYMKWREDEVILGVVFQIYILEE